MGVPYKVNWQDLQSACHYMHARRMHNNIMCMITLWHYLARLLYITLWHYVLIIMGCICLCQASIHLGGFIHMHAPASFSLYRAAHNHLRTCCPLPGWCHMQMVVKDWGCLTGFEELHVLQRNWGSSWTWEVSGYWMWPCTASLEPLQVTAPKLALNPEL